MVDGDLEDGAPLHEACAAGRPGRASLEKFGLDPRAQMLEHASRDAGTGVGAARQAGAEAARGVGAMATC
jgi:hypothetical protein